jgi:hypothetical protein
MGGSSWRTAGTPCLSRSEAQPACPEDVPGFAFPPLLTKGDEGSWERASFMVSAIQHRREKILRLGLHTNDSFNVNLAHWEAELERLTKERQAGVGTAQDCHMMAI